jgi:hypothetical protein
MGCLLEFRRGCFSHDLEIFDRVVVCFIVLSSPRSGESKNKNLKVLFRLLKIK